MKRVEAFSSSKNKHEPMSKKIKTEGGRITIFRYEYEPETIKRDGALTYLNLMNNLMGNKGAEKLAEMLEGNATLTYLDLGFNDIGGQGAEKLAEMLEGNATLTYLDLGFNDIGGQGAEKLAEAFKGNATLTYLNLMSNQIDSKGAGKLAEAFKGNKTLTTLDLNGNHIKNETTKKLAEMLEGNATLTYLNLGISEIGGQGVKNLVGALNENSVLTSLMIMMCNEYLQGAEAISQMLERNKSLTSLKITLPFYFTNEVDEEARKAQIILVKALDKNFHLRTFDFLAEPIIRHEVNSALQENQELFDSVVEIIKHPFRVEGNNIYWSAQMWQCKFFQEVPEAVFHQALGQEYSMTLSRFKDEVPWGFFFLSGVCKNSSPLPIPDELLMMIIKNNLKFGDISWNHAPKDTLLQGTNSAVFLFGDHDELGS
jgi:Ran GTPase-activating protein (RanGAP) involved in mRNA processing and transport